MQSDVEMRVLFQVDKQVSATSPHGMKSALYEWRDGSPDVRGREGGRSTIPLGERFRGREGYRESG